MNDQEILMDVRLKESTAEFTDDGRITLFSIRRATEPLSSRDHEHFSSVVGYAMPSVRAVIAAGADWSVTIRS